MDYQLLQVVQAFGALNRGQYTWAGFLAECPPYAIEAAKKARKELYIGEREGFLHLTTKGKNLLLQELKR